MKKIMLITTLLLSGCTMTNEAVIDEVKKCSDAGYGMVIKRTSNGDIARIICDPEKPIENKLDNKE